MAFPKDESKGMLEGGCGRYAEGEASHASFNDKGHRWSLNDGGDRRSSILSFLLQANEGKKTVALVIFLLYAACILERV
ncbi:hypothetical protein K457DRAFT_135951, partial [Linnemannia elongata AG-77]